MFKEKHLLNDKWNEKWWCSQWEDLLTNINPSQISICISHGSRNSPSGISCVPFTIPLYIISFVAESRWYTQISKGVIEGSLIKGWFTKFLVGWSGTCGNGKALDSHYHHESLTKEKGEGLATREF